MRKIETELLRKANNGFYPYNYWDEVAFYTGMEFQEVQVYLLKWTKSLNKLLIQLGFLEIDSSHFHTTDNVFKALAKALRDSLNTNKDWATTLDQFLEEWLYQQFNAGGDFGRCRALYLKIFESGYLSEAERQKLTIQINAFCNDFDTAGRPSSTFAWLQYSTQCLWKAVYANTNHERN